MRSHSLLSRALGVEGAVVEDARWEEGPRGPIFVVSVRPRSCERRRCPQCGRRCPGYDQGDGLRRWRTPDVGLVEACVESHAPRVRCREHGVVVARVPWADAGSRFTRAFEHIVAWLATRMDKTSISTLMRVSWRTVTAILGRVVEAARAREDPLDGLVKIGIDEVSYRKGHRYLIVVIDHVSGRLLWASPGRDEATLEEFFELLGPERSASIAFVSADAARWIRNVVRRRAPQATICMDAFHVVQWATKALDEVRRNVWNDLRKSGKRALAETLKRSRWALWKNPENLTVRQKSKLATIEVENRPLYRAYLLKEQLREVIATKGAAGMVGLDAWVNWATRSRLEPFVDLARSIRKHRKEIDATLAFHISNARVEAANTKMRLLTRMAFGFHSPQPLINLAMLKIGGLGPNLPGRS